jgi:hypothetical protein
MDAVAFNKQLDSKLAASGEVNQEIFFKFTDAHNYDAASSVGWLEAKLRVLQSRISRGEALSLYDPETKSQRIVATIAEFVSWVSINFPSADV